MVFLGCGVWFITIHTHLQKNPKLHALINNTQHYVPYLWWCESSTRRDAQQLTTTSCCCAFSSFLLHFCTAFFSSKCGFFLRKIPIHFCRSRSVDEPKRNSSQEMIYFFLFSQSFISHFFFVIRFICRFQLELRLEFDTKLGMHSPI